MAYDGIILPKSVTAEGVLAITQWTEDLFSFRLTRPAAFRFRSGEFVMLGLMDGAKPLLRAYSIASPAWDDGLEFYSITAPGGALTPKLRTIKPGDRVLLGRKPTGTLVLDALKPGRSLYLLSTGTGVAPFASLLRESETYERFERVVLSHTCRNSRDLAYGKSIVAGLADDPLVGPSAARRVTYYPTTTREVTRTTGRITSLLASGRFFSDNDCDRFSPDADRVMICGSSAMIADTSAIIEAAGLREGSNAAPGEYVVEKAFVS